MPLMALFLLLAGDTSPVSLAGTLRFWFLRTTARWELQSSQPHLWSNLSVSHTSWSKPASDPSDISIPSWIWVSQKPKEIKSFRSMAALPSSSVCLLKQEVLGLIPLLYHSIPNLIGTSSWQCLNNSITDKEMQCLTD